jgi:hypothetical protein
MSFVLQGMGLASRTGKTQSVCCRLPTSVSGTRSELCIRCKWKPFRARHGLLVSIWNWYFQYTRLNGVQPGMISCYLRFLVTNQFEDRIGNVQLRVGDLLSCVEVDIWNK